MQERVDFLTASGIPLEAVAKAVVSHPQVLPYPILACNNRLCNMSEPSAVPKWEQKVACNGVCLTGNPGNKMWLMISKLDTMCHWECFKISFAHLVLAAVH